VVAGGVPQFGFRFSGVLRTMRYTAALVERLYQQKSLLNLPTSTDRIIGVVIVIAMMQPLVLG
jgi:hypothetical protein